MSAFFALWTLAYAGAWAANGRRALGWVLPVAGITLLIAFRDVAPGWRLLASSFLFLYLMKGACVAVLAPTRNEALPWSRLLPYFTVWPGMDAESFLKTAPAPAEAGPRFVRGLLALYLGIGLFLLCALFQLPPLAAGWLGIAAILTTVHFGISNLLTASLQMVGIPVKPLFERPLASRSLKEFWTRRWNLAFVEMNRRLFMPGLTKRFGLGRAIVGTFLISGALHEMAISYPAGSGWGGPMGYFAIQAALVAIERRLPRSRWFTWAAILLPLPILFHSAFREAFILPLLAAARGEILAMGAERILGWALWGAASLHLLILTASFQVPSRLRWREELPLLSSFNRKLMWTYGLFIVLCIVGFSVLTFSFHDRFVHGEALARGLAGFIAIFWLLRVIVDCFYFDHRDWPEGPQFVAGHALLTSLFSFLVLVYGIVALRP